MSAPGMLVESEVEEIAPKEPWLATLLGAMRRWPLGAAGAIIVVLMIVMRPRRERRRFP